ncbi:hypothetical protein [Nocardioides sp.]|uniref:hypothetical protein n=1 Tax=Nocardioides sp. TaxID=35761 RepID=UPI003515CEA2
MPSFLRFAFVATVITALALVAVAGSSRLSGPVIFTFSASHGVHRDDLFVVALWAVSIAWCWWHRHGGRRRRRH